MRATSCISSFISKIDIKSGISLYINIISKFSEYWNKERKTQKDILAWHQQTYARDPLRLDGPSSFDLTPVFFDLSAAKINCESS